MKVINQIKAWYNEVVANSDKKRKAIKEKSLAVESCQVLQAMEFNGELYICFKGTPIIREDLLTSTIPDVLEDSRNVYMNYITNKEE